MVGHKYATTGAAVKLPQEDVQANVSFSTPLKRKTASAHGSGTGSENVKTPPISQDELKSAMRDELGRCIWESETILEELLPADDALVEKVLQDLEASVLTHKNLSWKKNTRTEQWPSTVVERDYYDPLVWLMNFTLDVVRENQSSGSRSYHRFLRFSRYDKSTKDGIEKAHPLKPDAVGCDRDIPPTERVTWVADIKIPVEVKDRWAEIVAQAGTYARAMVVSFRGQIWTLVIGFNHIKCEFRFLFYHPGGLTSSTPFCLKTVEGWRKFVSAMVGLVSLETRHAAGFDVSRDNTHIQVPTIGLCEEEELLFGHHSVRGRRTLVCRVNLPQKQSPPQPSPATSKAVLPENASPVHSPRYNTRSHARRMAPRISNYAPRPSAQAAVNIEDPKKLPDRGKQNKQVIEPIEPKPENSVLTCYNEPFELENTNLPAKGVLKTSWPLLIRNTEGEMYKDVSGLFGAPEVICSYNVNGPDGKPYGTRSLIPGDSTYWNVFGDSVDGIEPELRVPSSILFKTEGRSLITANSPYELLEGVLHGIIGYANHYYKGWMHRDISVGNVLLHERTRRPRCTLFQVTSQLDDCIAMLIDGDQAIKWTSFSERAAGRSVTLPFLSIRLAQAWAYNTPFTHTAIDDLESFLWLLLWCTLCIVEERGSPCMQESEALFTVRSDQLRLHMRRDSLIRELKGMVDYGSGSKMSAFFLPLMLSWQSISDRAVNFANEWSAGNVPTNEDEDVFVYFKEYLEVGFSQLKNMPRSWEGVFDEQ